MSSSLRPAAGFQRVSERLRRNDLSQLLAGFLALLAFVLMITWPEPREANNSWYALAQTRMVALLLLSLQFGGLAYRRSPRDRMAILLALFVFLLLSLPLDLGSYAASFPSVPWAWSLAVTWVDMVAFFGLGLLTARVLGRLGHGIVLTMALLSIFAVTLLADLWWGHHILNPLLALMTVSPLHLSVMALIALPGLWQLFKAQRPAGPYRDGDPA